MPPIRKLILPDPGYLIFDVDLSGADAQVVAWEAEDADLKKAFKAGVKIHVKNFEDYWQKPFLPEYKYRIQPGRLYPPYDEMKRAVHATNYIAAPRTVAVTLQWKISEAEAFQRRWFQLHPGIRQWHRRIEKDIQLTRTVTNRFGYRRVYFERPTEVLSEAVAWQPQSTVALVTARAGVALRKNLPWLQVLMQVHDSLVFQIPFHRYTQRDLDTIRNLIHIPVPYPDPLIIPWGIAGSPKSWGDCQSVKWEALSEPWADTTKTG